MTSDMKHPPAERLEAFVEGLLDGGDRAVVESHVLGCAHCQAAVEEWRALFTALSGLPQFEPAPGFADRVMAGLELAPARRRRAAPGRLRRAAPGRLRGWNWQSAQAALAGQAAAAAAALGRLMPKTTFGWALATAFVSLPFILGAAALGWLMSRSYITPQSLWAYLSTQAVDGMRALGETAVSTALQTDVAAWLVSQGGAVLEQAGFTGIGMIAAAAGLTTVLASWVLYRNLFRTPARESTYASYSF
jgi:hypothetical protein